MKQFSSLASSLLILASVAFTTTSAQSTSRLATGSTRIVIGGASPENDSLIVIPPSTTWTARVGLADSKARPSQSDIMSWIHKSNARNGLDGLSSPWHLVISYEQFDEDGDKIHSGVFEEIWANPKQYRISYKADDFNQTDYATAHGLYRLGDQRWPNQAQIQVAKEIIAPFSYAATLRGVHISDTMQTFGSHVLSCAVVENAPGFVRIPTEYCFDLNGSGLRYSRGFGWYQTTYNDLITFSGTNVGKTVDVYDGGKQYLKLRVEKLETADVEEKDFTPSQDAKSLNDQVLTGVSPIPVKQTLPEWPDLMRQDHFSVTVEILIGKDGRVESAHALSGPERAFKSAETTLRKWTFQPYLVLGEPAQVKTKVILSNN